MVQTILSQALEDYVAGDKDLPSVPIAASIEASRIIADLLGPRMRIEGDAVIRTVEAWSRPELAKLKAKMLVLWKSRAYRNDLEAAEAINGTLLDMGHAPMGSKETIRRILGKRT